MSAAGAANMVGIVIVAHSRLLAEGAAELGRQMGVGQVPVEPAGGDADGGLGTSIELVERAVRAADRGAGVVLLADIGSSVLTAKTFIEDRQDGQDGQDGGAAEDAGGAAEDPGGAVVFADAPLVEGVVAAASAAAGGADLAAVVRAAAEAYDFRKTR
ncbi:MAG TPA: phosphoenolpyruvate--protein phosphotransferase [Streptosporangiaceae bacterium]|nr:phosphoenolpyruvate--protein phosphotransferase [Streptosporangiaceae bacterium]